MIMIAVKQWLCTTRTFAEERPFEPRLENLLSPTPSAHAHALYCDEPTPQQLLMATGKLGLIVGYFFLCDRSGFAPIPIFAAARVPRKAVGPPRLASPVRSGRLLRLRRLSVRRSSLFMKENKYFSQLNFWLPIGYVFALGLFFTEDTAHTRLLHRDMANEWKGGFGFGRGSGPRSLLSHSLFRRVRIPLFVVASSCTSVVGSMKARWG